MRILKRIVEMIFIFILPILLLLCTFKKSFVYDNNNNVVSERLEFINIFNISEGDTTYYNYHYYSTDEIINLSQGEEIYVNYNVSPIISLNDNIDIILFRINDEVNSLAVNTDNVSHNISNWDIEFNDFSVCVIRMNSTSVNVVNKYNNLIKDFDTITLRDNIVNKGITIIFSYLGIENNIVMQLLVVYVLLMLVMLLIWYVIYVPFDMLFGLLLRKLEYYR